MNLLNLELPTFSEINREREQRLKSEARAQRNRERNVRTYLAGQRNRLNQDWPILQSSQRGDVYRGLRNMRARHRYLAQNSDHFKKFLSLMRNNVAGPFGMRLVSAGGTDTQNEEILAAWEKWSLRQNASANHRRSFRSILRTIMTVWARDGEVLLRKIYGRNRFGYSLAFIDLNWLDELYNETRPNGTRIVMSVELDELDQPVAYWLTPPATEWTYQPIIKTRTRIPADEIFHLVLPDDENSGDDSQTRGVPWGHTGSLSLFNLDRADEANLYSMRAGASKMGFFKPPEETDEVDGDDPNAAEDEETRAPLIDHFEPGTFWEMPPGYEFTAFDPKFPNDAHDPFAKYILRRTAAGFDVSYHSLTGDLSDVNFSSIRFGVDQERIVFKALQEELKDQFCRSNFSDWLKSAVLANQLTTVRPRDLDNLDPDFQGHRWPYFDPLKDIQADRLAIEAGLDTITDSLAERGKDIKKVFKTRKAELELAKSEGIPLTSGAGTLLPGTLDQQGDEQAKPKPAPKPQPAAEK